MANNRYYHRNNRGKKKPNMVDTVLEKYSSAQLARTVDDLGISEALCEMLTKNGINTAAELVLRTEKDMYRLQGFNKKMLNELRATLRKSDMEFRREQQPQPAQVKQKAASQQANAQKPQGGQNADGTQQSSKFGLADRRAASKPQQQMWQRPFPKQEKLTEPLPVDAWRKVMKGGKWGYSDGLKIVIPTMYDEIFCFKEGLASVEIDGKCGYIDAKNNVVIPLDYDIAMSFSEGYAMVVKGDKCGYINKNNEVVIPFVYAAATPFEDGEAKVKKDGKWATLTADGKLTWI